MEKSIDKRNDTVRIDTFQEVDDHLAVSLMAFFRMIEQAHVYHEHFLPTLKAGDSHVFTAVRDRPWPPWGPGARKVGALCQIHAVSAHGFAISPVYAAEHDDTNIGLMMAVYKEALEHIGRTARAEVNYLVADDSVLADRVLRSAGFKRSNDAVLTEQARYHFYRAPAAALAAELGLTKLSIPELLAHEIPDATFERNALYHLAIDRAAKLGAHPGLTKREIIAILAGMFNPSLPGGVPPTPPTPGPSSIIIEIDPGDVIDRPR